MNKFIPLKYVMMCDSVISLNIITHVWMDFKTELPLLTKLMKKISVAVSSNDGFPRTWYNELKASQRALNQP